MNLKDIKSRAKHLHKILIIGVASLSLLGMLSGCHKNSNNNISNTTLTKVLVNRQIHSKSLAKMLTRQYKWPVSDDSDALVSDILLHKGYVEQSDDDMSSGRYFSNYGRNYDETQPSDDKSKSARRMVHYHINNDRDTITFDSVHVDNTLHTITYKLISPNKYLLVPSKQMYKLKPIRLRRFGHKSSAKVPNSIAKHNILKIHVGRHVHHKYDHSLNNVQK